MHYEFQLQKPKLQYVIQYSNVRREKTNFMEMFGSPDFTS